MELFGLEFAPFNIPLKRRLQTLATAAWFVVMAFGGFIGFLLSLYIMVFTKFWWAMCLYYLWIYIDRETADKGGRRSEWIRGWAWWAYLRAYFPLRMDRLPWVELNRRKNYLFCCFPHGMLCTGPFGAFGVTGGGFHDFFPNHTPHIFTLAQHFSMPFFRELAFGLGGCSASAKCINNVMSKPGGGNVGVLMVGGATEAFYCKPRTYKIILTKRKGFVKLALQNGCSLVPVFSFGETDLFDQVSNPEGSFVRKLQEWLKQYIGIAPAIPVGRGFFQYNFGMIPKRKPVTTVVGEPIDVVKTENPSREEVETLHEKFTQSLINLFETQKGLYIKDAEEVKLEIL